VKAAADSVPRDVLTEEVIPRPIGPYGESKIKAEEYLLSKRDSADSLGRRVFILRPCMIHGPGNKGLSINTRIKKKTILGLPIPLNKHV